LARMSAAIDDVGDKALKRFKHETFQLRRGSGPR
jgi:hypothetical protein